MVSNPTFFTSEIISGLEVLDREESRHCIKVLRKRTGDLIRIIDGKGTEAEFEIIESDPTNCKLKLVSSTIHKKSSPGIHIGIAPTKQLERMEWFIEKTSEIGIDEITFLKTSNSERKSVNLDRAHKKAITALKQSGNVFLPEIHDQTPFSQFVQNCNSQQKFIAYLEEGLTRHLFDEVLEGTSVTVLIGPEGDFTQKEIEEAKQNNFVPISLGKSRLRTETAGLMACHMVSIKNSVL